MTVCVHRGEGWLVHVLVHVRVCVHGTREVGEGGFRTCAYIHGEGRSNWRVGVCAWAGWEQSRRNQWCMGGKLEGLCKLNYLVNW